MCEIMLEEVHAVRREVKGSDIEAFGKSVTWWVGVGTGRCLGRGQQYGPPSIGI